MKRLLLLLVLTVTGTILYAQKSIDTLFEKYAGKDGFTTVTINGNLLKLFSCLDDDKDNNNNRSSMPAKISEIRILAQEDDKIKVENFYDLVIKDIDLDSYDEFMRVKESDQDLRMLVKSEGRTFKEFLLIAGGDDNAVIQIKGSITFNEAKKLSEDATKNHGLNLTTGHK